jgi:hypothetical protein
MAYLGEALMRVGGGHWEFGPHPTNPSVEVPVACPDEALGLPPISPLGLIIDAIRERSGDLFTRAHAELGRAVAGRRAVDPFWSPTKEPSIAADAAPLPPVDHLVSWLAMRERSFDRWVRDEAGGTDTLDFSRGSLRALHALVRRWMPGGEADFDKPERRELVDGAAWYLGEVAVRTTRAEWQYRDGDPAVNPLAGTPYLESFGPAGNMLFPVASLMAAAESDDPGYLDKTLSRFD